MFPRLFDELKHTRVYQESIRSVINTQLISIDVLSALSYKPCFIMRLPVSIDLIRSHPAQNDVPSVARRTKSSFDSRSKLETIPVCDTSMLSSVELVQ